MPDSIVLAYSGGLDTSVAVHWLKAHYQSKVTAVLVDLGQPKDELTDAHERAIANGAEECVIVPACDLFADEYLAPAIRANALYEGAYPLGTALARPLIAKALVQVAHQIGADAVAHGCTGKGNDQVRIENGIRTLAPELEILAPQRTHPMDRPQAIHYAEAHHLQLPTQKTSPYSIDENLWTRSIEGDDVEDPAVAPPETAYAWTTAPEHTPETPEAVTLTFHQGLPVAINGEALPLAALIAKLNPIAGAHGIGRIDHVESRIVGIKSREIYEAPAATVILNAKKALESLTLTRDELHAKLPLETQFARLTYDGHHWTPLMSATTAFLDAINGPVDGEVTLKLHQGRLTVQARTSPKSLFDAKLATYNEDDAFDHNAASGFLKISGLPLATAARARTPKTDVAADPMIVAGIQHE